RRSGAARGGAWAGSAGGGGAPPTGPTTCGFRKCAFGLCCVAIRSNSDTPRPKTRRDSVSTLGHRVPLILSTQLAHSNPKTQKKGHPRWGDPYLAWPWFRGAPWQEPARLALAAYCAFRFNARRTAC